MGRKDGWLLTDLREAVRLYNNENWTLEKIGRRFGVTKERARQVLQACGVNTDGRVRTHEQKICKICGRRYSVLKSDLTFRSRGICSQKCWRPRVFVGVTCSECGHKMRIPKRRFKVNTSGLFFCNRICQGRYAGRHYGFIEHPENRMAPVKSVKTILRRSARA